MKHKVEVRMVGSFVVPVIFILTLLLACNDNTQRPEVYRPTRVAYDTLPVCMEYVWGKPTQIIDTEAEYDSLILRKNPSCPPEIDFSRYTLLGQNATAGGCHLPDYYISVIRDDIKREIIYKLQIIQHGYCDIGILSYKWILIPKIPHSYKIVFEKELIKREIF